MRVVLVSLDTGRNGEEPLDPDHPSGRRLAQLASLSGDGFRSRFDKINLYPVPGRPPSEDRAAGANLLPILRGRRVVALGGRVADALGIPLPHFQWVVRGPSGVGFVGARMSHPSGLVRWWNDPTNVRVAGEFVRSLLRPCVHVEGVDGSGKTTLVADLASRLGLPVLSTEGPPTDWSECLRWVGERVSPGVVSDRSSGLVSELVYGPVLRGGVCCPDGEEGVWHLLRSVVGAVTFVYCRPPDSILFGVPVGFRPSEDPSHVQGVRDRLTQLLERYDIVVRRMVREGFRVVVYDRTRQRPEEVAECVE